MNASYSRYRVYFPDDTKPDQSYANQNGGPKSSLIQKRDETKKSKNLNLFSHFLSIYRQYYFGMLTMSHACCTIARRRVLFSIHRAHLHLLFSFRSWGKCNNYQALIHFHRPKYYYVSIANYRRRKSMQNIRN